MNVKAAIKRFKEIWYATPGDGPVMYPDIMAMLEALQSPAQEECKNCYGKGFIGIVGTTSFSFCPQCQRQSTTETLSENTGNAEKDNTNFTGDLEEQIKKFSYERSLLLTPYGINMWLEFIKDRIEQARYEGFQEALNKVKALFGQDKP